MPEPTLSATSGPRLSADLAVKAYPWVKAPPGFAAPAGAPTTCVAELTDGFRCFGDPVILEHRYERLGA